MGETVEMFQQWKQHVKAEKAERAIESAKALTKAGISWSSHNNGVHLIIYFGDKQINLWPSTGLWMFQGSKFRRHGVETLIEYINTKSI